jgi:hypothetical protein
VVECTHGFRGLIHRVDPAHCEPGWFDGSRFKRPKRSYEYIGDVPMLVTTDTSLPWVLMSKYFNVCIFPRCTSVRTGDIPICSVIDSPDWSVSPDQG